jgi:hypothetical protein
MASFVAEAQAMLAGGGAVAGFERIGSAKSSDSVLRSSSSEDDGGGKPQRTWPGPTGLGDSETSGRSGDGRPRWAETMKMDSRGSTKVTPTRTVSEDDDDAGTINHAGFFGYDGMMGISPRTDLPRRRRALPASRASVHDASCRVQRPDFGTSPEHLEAAVRGQDMHDADLHASPSRPRSSRLKWDVSLCGGGGGLSAFASNSMSDRIKPREAPVIVDRQRPAQAPEDVRPPPLVAPNERLPGSLPTESRTALAPRLEENASSSSSDDRWRAAAAYSKADRAGLPKHQAARQSLRADGQAQRLGRRDVATSLASQSGQYGQAAGVLESPESSAFEKLRAVRVLGRLHAVGMFEARQPLLRAVNCESKMVRVAAVHELLAAPAASHAIGVEQRIELGRILTRVLDQRDDSSGLGVSPCPCAAWSPGPMCWFSLRCSGCRCCRRLRREPVQCARVVAGTLNAPSAWKFECAECVHLS